jgi:branched-subunit amino acid aminotransferase/4-amino-4-deoxychorismate lyase
MDYVSINGKLQPAETLHGSVIGIPTDYVYQRIHAMDGRALHAELHLALAESACNDLYRRTIDCDAERLNREVRELLESNKYYIGSVEVMMYVYPDALRAYRLSRLLVCRRKMVYNGYVLWHTAPCAVPLAYEYPFPQYSTAISFAAHGYAADYAAMRGAHTAISLNGAAEMVSICETPLFLSYRNIIYTPPLALGIADSVERRLGIAAAIDAGYRVEVRAFPVEDSAAFDEIFTVEPQGVTSIREFRKRLFTNSAARRVSEFMNSYICTPLPIL